MRELVPRWVYRFRGVLISLPTVFALLCFFRETEDDRLIWPLGVSIFVLGLLLRVWAQQHIRRRLKAPKHLVTTGPYSLVRNPLYIGNILMCLGVTVVSELLWLVPATVLWCVVLYSIVVRHEEERLLRRYGEPYRRYALEVPRWFPLSWHFRNMGLINEYFRASMVSEVYCLLWLLPYVFKEIISQWFEH